MDFEREDFLIPLESPEPSSFSTLFGLSMTIGENRKEIFEAYPVELKVPYGLHSRR